MASHETVMARANCHGKNRNCHGKNANYHGESRNCHGASELSRQPPRLSWEMREQSWSQWNLYKTKKNRGGMINSTLYYYLPVEAVKLGFTTLFLFADAGKGTLLGTL
ncbi:hypothetical protein MKY41_00205 [Sporosarcina sp. FSL W7-1349]|uniref:hypothetical protein n=1 Tax=Sporosarcina sp. FSL W7-1349 TaxID=2921561 RepID=UPI0030FCC8C3